MCIGKQCHLLLLSREPSAPQSAESSDRCLCAVLFQLLLRGPMMFVDQKGGPVSKTVLLPQTGSFDQLNLFELSFSRCLPSCFCALLSV